MAETKDLGVLLDAKIPIIGVESPDEQRVLALLLRFAMHRGLEFREWTVTRGLQLSGFGERLDKTDELQDPEALLRHIANTPGKPR